MPSSHTSDIYDSCYSKICYPLLVLSLSHTHCSYFNPRLFTFNTLNAWRITRQVMNMSSFKQMVPLVMQSILFVIFSSYISLSSAHYPLFIHTTLLSPSCTSTYPHLLLVLHPLLLSVRDHHQQSPILISSAPTFTSLGC